jgi:hypothetical protein
MTLLFAGGLLFVGVACIAWISATLRAPQIPTPPPQPLLFEQHQPVKP